MRKLLFFILLCTGLQAEAAIIPLVTDTVPSRSGRYMPTESDYLRKSRKLTTTGAILGGVGAGMIIGGSIILSNDNDDDIDDLGDPNSNLWVGIVLIIFGSLAAIASIPLFIIGAHMRGKARRASMAFKAENYNNIKSTGFAKSYYPAVGIRIPL